MQDQTSVKKPAEQEFCQFWTAPQGLQISFWDYLALMALS